ncbi:hypothetical protein RLEG12_01080 (plasmid) [Rhizobium leguminosarum bv. trifolii CB782]|nr:hypothetical protein RLEG12_01080 [Rhizobium leguminosarum bv. trifolii CB782]
MFILGLSPNSRVVRLTRLHSSAGRPLAVERTCYSSEFQTDLLRVRPQTCTTLGEAKFEPVRAIQRIFACNIEDPDASMLGVTTGAVGLLTKTVAYLATGRAVEFTRSIYRGDADCFVTELAVRDT